MGKVRFYFTSILQFSPRSIGLSYENQNFTHTSIALSVHYSRSHLFSQDLILLKHVSIDLAILYG